jgi:polysaccharide pyruvyl transferase WcaK-like protein
MPASGRPPGRRSESFRAAVRPVPLVAPILRMGMRFVRRASRAGREPAFIVRTYRYLRGSDLLMIAGSNQLEDWFGGPWGYPYTLLLWTALGRLAGAPVAFVSVGAGPLDSPLSRWMCVRALRLATYVSFRDSDSLRLMRRLGYRGTAGVVPDLAVLLQMADLRQRPSRVPPRVAINPFPHQDPQYDPRATTGDAAFGAYVDSIAALVVEATSRGFVPILFGTQRADARIIDLVQAQIDTRAPSLGEFERRMPQTLDDLIALIDDSDAIVATRYHAILFGILRGRPSVGICYQSKSKRLLEMADLAQYAVEVQHLNGAEVLDRITPPVSAVVPDELIVAAAAAMRAECDTGLSEALHQCLPDASAAFDMRGE